MNAARFERRHLGAATMNTELSEEATEFGRQARRALEAAGGDQLVVLAEQDPVGRASLVTPVLGELGAWALDPRGDADELEAAAALCRSAGYWAIPYPVAERLSRPVGLDVEVDGLVVVTGSAPAAAVAGLPLRWAAVTLTGRRSLAVPRPSAAPPRPPAAPPRPPAASPQAFVTALDLKTIDHDGAKDVALGLVLPCWTLLGMLDRAIDLTRAHVLVRQQFGQPLAAFQGVQFQLTDAEVERSGVEVLAKYALWSIQAGSDDALDGALDDALALRLAAIEAAEIVFRVAHQLHGAIGFCDEAPLSWLSRSSQPLRRLPFGRSATLAQLADRVGRRGLTGLFSQPRETR
jgi:3-oxo-4-pregnene-20-carboxyl-CoA dehydrogenase alpha subunit